MAMFHMSSDSSLFRTAAEFETEGSRHHGINWVEQNTDIVWVPLYEAKMVYFYDYRAASYAERREERGFRVLPDTTDAQHAEPEFETQPYYWVKKSNINARIPPNWKYDWLFGFKDITSPISERTVIVTVLPLVGVGHTMPLLFTSPIIGPLLSAALLGNLCSIVLDFLARQKIGGLHLTYSYLKQLPTIPPAKYLQNDLDFITSRVMELAYTSEAMRPFAQDLGYDGPPFAWNPDRRTMLRAELDAYYAWLYGLTRDELRYILDPADVMGPHYPSETFRVLKERELSQLGEYRTQRLVLEAWDRRG